MEDLIFSFNQTLNGIFLGLSYADFAIPIGLSLWSTLFLFDFKNVDCSDLISAGVYITYCAMAGVFVVFIAPQEFLTDLTFKDYLIWTFVFAALSAIRWARAYTVQTRKIETYIEKGEKDGK